MYMNDILRYCENHGRKYSRTAIYNAGKKYGFAIKVSETGALEFNKEKFLEWFNKGREEVPEGFVKVSELIKRYDIDLNFAYLLIKDPACDTRVIGAGKGITYVNTDGIEELIEKHRNKRKYDWN